MSHKRKHTIIWRQRAPLAILAIAALAGCAQGTSQPGISAVAADEPRAALVGREILAAGGSAADAATAAYFAMMVTLPTSAGLGGGGVCLSYDTRGNRVEAIDFIPRAPAAGGAAAVPSAARGLYALQAKYGRLRWEQVVAPAEGLARFGFAVSRALANDIAAAAPRLAQDPEARRLLLRPDGAAPAEGDTLIQSELSTVLAAIRSRGPGDFYAGSKTRDMVEAGVGITAEDLRAVLPTWRPTVIVRYDELTVHFAPPPAVAGVMSGQLFAMLAPRWRRAGAEERPHLLAEAELRAAWDRQQWLALDLTTKAPIGDLVGSSHITQLMASYRADRRTPPASLRPPVAQRPANPAAASVVAVDREGGAVACSATMNDAFGLGRIVPGTGMLLAAAPDAGARNAQALNPMIAVRQSAGQIVFVGASSGGWPGVTALVEVALRTIVETRPLEEAIDATRLYYPGDPDQVLVEVGVQPRQLGLTERGYTVTPVTALGRINAIACPDGMLEKPTACQFRADRRGFGLANGS